MGAVIIKEDINDNSESPLETSDDIYQGVYADKNDASDEKHVFTDWENEPKIKDFKQDYSDAQSDHDAHTNDVKSWLDNLNIEGAAKIEKKKGRSSIVPKLIRKQAEWRYSSLSEPDLEYSEMVHLKRNTSILLVS